MWAPGAIVCKVLNSSKPFYYSSQRNAACLVLCSTPISVTMLINNTLNVSVTSGIYANDKNDVIELRHIVVCLIHIEDNVYDFECT